MMKVGRRGVLRAFAALGVGGKHVAAEAVKATTAAFSQTGIAVGMVGDMEGSLAPEMPPGMYGSGSAGKYDPVSQAQKMVARVARTKLLGIPSYMQDNWRDYSAPHVIDIDIASLVSVSPVAKRRMQHERNIKFSQRHWENMPTRRLQEALWNQSFGDGE